MPSRERAAGRQYHFERACDAGTVAGHQALGRGRVARDQFSIRPEYEPHLLGFGQPGAGVRFIVPAGRQSLYVERDRVQRDQRQDHVVASVHAERQPRLRRDRLAHPDRHQDQRRGPQDRRACRPQRLHLQLRSSERPVPQGHTAREGGDLDQGHRSRRPASRSITIPSSTSRNTTRTRRSSPTR